MALRQKGAEADIPLSVNHLRIQSKGSYIMQGSLLFSKIEFFIKGDMRGLSFFSGGHL